MVTWIPSIYPSHVSIYIAYIPAPWILWDIYIYMYMSYIDMVSHCHGMRSEVRSRLHPDHCEASARHRPPAQWDVQKNISRPWEYDGNMIDLY